MTVVDIVKPFMENFWLAFLAAATGLWGILLLILIIAWPIEAMMGKRPVPEPVPEQEAPRRSRTRTVECQAHEGGLFVVDTGSGRLVESCFGCAMSKAQPIAVAA